MYYNYYSRIHYVQPQQSQQSYNPYLVSPRISIIPTSIKQMKDPIQIPYNQDIMKATQKWLNQLVILITNNDQKIFLLYFIQSYILNMKLVAFIEDKEYHYHKDMEQEFQLYTQNSEVYSEEWFNNLYEGFGILINQSQYLIKHKINPQNLNTIEDGILLNQIKCMVKEYQHLKIIRNLQVVFMVITSFLEIGLKEFQSDNFYFTAPYLIYIFYQNYTQLYIFIIISTLFSSFSLFSS
ncbi:unnamed protein product [Paramecium sonneborni]|uniref:Transmembrane protein n=1 Tax=Paramecium sonneborni TaxID=65129 RepID=A0A8S1Q687_9CILI|nr:unnamed protein product [Paramecium sonneborni]